MRQTRRPPLVPNPPWVTELLSSSYDQIQEQVKDHPEWLPKLVETYPSRGRLSAKIQEYGCGVYGCVIPTLDPRVVLKVTTDDTEAEFAAEWSSTLVAPICVQYYATMPLTLQHNKRYVTLLWRESADYVGTIDHYISDTTSDDNKADEALRLIDEQWQASQIAYRALREQAPFAESAIRDWLNRCEAMARQTKIPELRPLGDGLVEVYAAQGVLFGDIHAGNIGLVHRGDADLWVITDPGNIAVVRP